MAEHVITSPARVQTVNVIKGEPRGYQQLTVSTAAVSLTIPVSANAAMIVSQDDIIRWRDDATDPTSTVGVPLMPLNVLVLETAGQLSGFRAIRASDAGGDAKLNILYYERK